MWRAGDVCHCRRALHNQSDLSSCALIIDTNVSTQILVIMMPYLAAGVLCYGQNYLIYPSAFAPFSSIGVSNAVISCLVFS